jgi:hypothetical protein
METVDVYSENEIMSTSTLCKENAAFWSLTALVV